MKVLVTGGAGFIGSHLVDALLKKHYEVKVLDNLELPTHLKGKPDYLPKDIEFIKGDMINKKDLSKALENTEGIFHLAASGGFTGEIMKYVKSNTCGTALMLELIKEKKLSLKKIVVASSIAVYGEGKYMCKEHGVFYPDHRPLKQLMKGEWDIKGECGRKAEALATDEKTLINPATIYGITKYDQERLVLNFGKQNNIPSTALRFFVTYGPRQSIFNPYTGVCSIFSTRILNNKKPVIYEDGNQTRDFVYVDDVVNACLLAFKSKKANYKVFNVGSGKATTIKYLAEALIKVYSKNIKPKIEEKFRIGDVRNMVADLSEIKKLGFKPSFSLEDGLKKYTEWIKSQGSLKEYFNEAEKILKKQGLIRKTK